jgi:hypothetical protein
VIRNKKLIGWENTAAFFGAGVRLQFGRIEAYFALSLVVGIRYGIKNGLSTPACAIVGGGESRFLEFA